MTPTMPGTVPIRRCFGLLFVRGRNGWMCRWRAMMVMHKMDLAKGWRSKGATNCGRGRVRQDKDIGTRGRLSCCLHIIFQGAMFPGGRFCSAMFSG